MPRPAPPERHPWVVEHRLWDPERAVEAHIRLTMSQEEGTDPQHLRQAALDHLRRLVSQLEADDWQRHSLLTGGQVKRSTGPVEGPFHLPPSQTRPPRPKLHWEPPDLPRNDLRTCHEILEGLLLLGIHGRAVPVGDLHKVRNIPQQRLYRVLEPGSPSYEYLAPYIQDLRSQGKRLLDLTPEGRQLASRIRSGEVVVPPVRRGRPPADPTPPDAGPPKSK